LLLIVSATATADLTSTDDTDAPNSVSRQSIDFSLFDRRTTDSRWWFLTLHQAMGSDWTLVIDGRVVKQTLRAIRSAGGVRKCDWGGGFSMPDTARECIAAVQLFIIQELMAVLQKTEQTEARSTDGRPAKIRRRR
jgi:hypothetical protein